MVVLNEFTEYGVGIIGKLSAIGLIFVSALLLFYISYCSIEVVNIYSHKRNYIIIITFLVLNILCVVGIFTNNEKKYKVYLTHITFEELAKEYEIVDIDNDVFTIKRKGEMMGGSS